MSYGRGSSDVSFQAFRWNKQGTTRLKDLHKLESDEKTNFFRLLEDLQNRLKQLEDKTVEKVSFVSEYPVDLSEIDIVLLVQTLIRHHFEEENEAEEDGILNQVLSLPYDEATLQKHLGKLTQDDTVMVIKYLRNLLVKCPVASTEGKSIGIYQILNWIGLLLDSHFNEFTLSEDAAIHQMLLSLQEIILEVIAPFQDIEDLSHGIATIRAKLPLPKTTHSGPYQIEMLYI